MKKVLLLLALAIFGQIAIAQNQQYQTALVKQKEAKGFIDRAKDLQAAGKADKAAKNMGYAKQTLQQAKDAIDKAAANEQTKNLAKTWHCYAVIYFEIGEYPEFKDMAEDPYEKAIEAFVKVTELDKEYYRMNMAEIVGYIDVISNTYFDAGNANIEEKKFEAAYDNFKKAYDIKARMGLKDNNAMLSAALCAMYAQKYDKSIEFFNALLENGEETSQVYQGLIVSYRGTENYDKMLETIATAREKYPEDEGIINEMINSYITIHREDEIIDQIEEMAAKNAEKPVYCYILGTIYGNSESKLYDVDKALANYDKVIAVDPNYVNAYINAGNVLIDKAQAKYFEAENLDMKDYGNNMNAYFAASDKIKDEAKAYDQRAMPYIERTHELLPDDPAVIQVLKGIYVRLNLNDKAAELEK